MKITRNDADALTIQLTQQELENLAYVVEEHGDLPYQDYRADSAERSLCASFMRHALSHLEVQH